MRRFFLLLRFSEIYNFRVLTKTIRDRYPCRKHQKPVLPMTKDLLTYDPSLDSSSTVIQTWKSHESQLGFSLLCGKDVFFMNPLNPSISIKNSYFTWSLSWTIYRDLLLILPSLGITIIAHKYLVGKLCIASPSLLTLMYLAIKSQLNGL
jgi:hypothetical protein